MSRGRFERSWFQQSFRECGFTTQRSIAKFLGCDPASVSMLFQGKRQLRIDEARLMSAQLGVSVQEVLKRAGIDIAPQVKLIGHVEASGAVTLLAKGDEADVDAPRDLPQGAYALQVRTHFSHLAAFDRWIVFVSGLREEPPHLLNRLALIGEHDGKMWLGYLTEGYRSGAVNIQLADSIRQNVPAIWAMRVLSASSPRS
jgi:transcriptional regulator with XRE-family HTH domain